VVKFGIAAAMLGFIAKKGRARPGSLGSLLYRRYLRKDKKLCNILVGKTMDTANFPVRDTSLANQTPDGYFGDP
jgi:hypothetical protein